MSATAPSVTPLSSDPVQQLDVVIVGAGLSGIGAAYRLREENPDVSYAVLEARDALGGTWDLFRYPGIRSDSDMYTLAFPFEPWTDPDAIASGEKILAYLKRTADKHGITEHVRFGHKVTRAEWDSTSQRWRITASTGSGDVVFEAKFVYACSGYYNYDEPYRAPIPGLDNFDGVTVHPQHWPRDLDVSGKRVVVIGSGATAVSLVPALADAGADVTMLQRTPTFLLSQPRRDPLNALLAGRLDDARRQALLRKKNMRLQWLLYRISQRAPQLTRKALNLGVATAAGREHVPSFNAPYDPWDQRMCIVPNGDFFSRLKAGDVRIVTDTIAQVEDKGIRTSSGQFLPADIIVTATGLAVQILGGAQLVVDGEPVDVSQRLIYRGCMLEGIPNAAVCIGYINASWGLRSDLSARFVARMVHELLTRRASAVIPRPPGGLERRPLLEMDSGYLRRAADLMPRRSRREPWTLRQDCIAEAKEMERPSLDEGLEWVYPGATGAEVA